MRVTAKGEYATQAVLHLSLQYPEVVTIHEIAQRHHIPLKYLEQILLELKRGGILESRPAPRGLYASAGARGDFRGGGVASSGWRLRGIQLRTQRSDGRSMRGGRKLRAKTDMERCAGAVEKILFATTFEEVRKRTLSGGARRTEFARHACLRAFSAEEKRTRSLVPL